MDASGAGRLNRSIILGLLLLPLVALLIGVAVVWWELANRPAARLRRAYERIEVGMCVSQVDDAIGWIGFEIPDSQLPGIVDRSQPIGSPGRSKAVVSGDTFRKWEASDGAYVIVGFSGEFVKEKYLYEPSL